jgi:VIT1/CCC1 family predicted Fe2+/Mn2+ transporter
MRAYITATGMARGMKADMPEQAREQFGRRIDEYDHALHREIAAQLSEIAASEGG